MPDKPNVKFTTREISEALRRCRGLVTVAAAMLGCQPSAIYRRMNKHPRLRRIVWDARCRLLDTAEQRLAEAVQAGRPWAILLTLKTLGKDRGYVERNGQAGVSVPDPTRGPFKITFKVVTKESCQQLPPVDRDEWAIQSNTRSRRSHSTVSSPWLQNADTPPSCDTTKANEPDTRIT